MPTEAHLQPQALHKRPWSKSLHKQGGLSSAEYGVLTQACDDQDSTQSA